MKKVIGLLLCIVSVCFISIPTDIVNAKTSITTSLSSKTDVVKKGEEVVITLRFSNYEGIKKGINTYKATLKYSKEIFEEVRLSDFTNRSGWENLKYNSDTNEFVAIKRTRTKKEEDVVQITLRVKKNVRPQKTVVSLTDIMVSEDRNDIYLNDVSKTISIVLENQDTNSNKNETSSNQNNKSDKVDKVSSSKPDQDSSNLDDNNSDEDNDKNNEKSDRDDVINNNNNDNASEKVEKKGVDPVYLVLIGAIVFVSGTLVGYFINKSKQVKLTSDLVKTNNIENNNNDVVERTLDNDNEVNDESNGGNMSNNSDNNSGKSNNIRMLMFLLLGSIFLQLAGSSCVYAQTLDLDSEFNYEDVDFLQRCLIHLEELSDDEIKEFDVNGDGKITAADVTLTVQVIEDILDYDVELFDFNVDNYYPLKGDTIKLSFSSKVAYGASIERLVINNQEYNVQKVSDRYVVFLNASIKSGIKSFHITEAILDNGKTTEIDYVQSVDVLKAMPRVENYSVVEDIRNQKLIISFDINDKDSSVVNSIFKVFDENTRLIKTEKLVNGRNIVEIDVQDGKKYKTSIEISYDLDTNNLEFEKDNTGIIKIEKELTLVTDYKFRIEDIVTYKDGVQSNSFNRNEKIELRFKSTNSTKYEPVKVKVNGNTYGVVKKNGSYVALINGFSSSGSNNIVIEEVMLGNGKLFELENNNSISVDVIKVKQKPSVRDLVILESENNLKVQFTLNDEDKTVKSGAVIVYNENDIEIKREYLSKSEIESGNITKILSVNLGSKCKVKIDVSYSITNITTIDEILADAVFNVPVKASITDSVSSNIYPAKKDIIMLTYGVETNSLVDVYKIRINNIDCMVRRTSDGKYKLVYQVKNISGIEELVATDIIYKDNTVSHVNNVIKIDVLKERPVVSEVLRTDNLELSEVNFDFDVTDNDNSFVSGKAVLTNLLDGTVLEKAITSGHNTLNFKVVAGVDYKLDIVYTYDLDTNLLDGTNDSDNRVTETIVEGQMVHLDVISNIVDDSELSYNLIDCSIYFSSKGTLVLRFRTENDIDLDSCKMSIDGKMYDIIDDGNYYLVELYDMNIIQLNSIFMRAILGDRDVISIKRNKPVAFMLNEVVEDTATSLEEVK